MKRSYIILSLIVSQALCANDVTADFSGKNGATPEEGKLKPASVTKGSPSESATYDKDWRGDTSYLDVKTNDLTFKFTSGSNETNLILTNGFDFTNRLTQDNPNAPTTANITIKKENGALETLTIGSTPSTSTYDYVTIGSNINLTISGFTNVNIQNILSIASGSTFDVSQSTNFTNEGGIILQGDKSTLKVNNSLKNNGTILMRDGSSIESVSSLDIDTTPPNAPTKGTITVQGKATINSGGSDLTIKNQDITLQNLASRNPNDKDKTTFTQAELTLKTTNTTNGTLTLGESASNGTVNIIGELRKTDDSITNLEGTSNVGKLVLGGYQTIEAKNVNFKNINLTTTSVNSVDFALGKLGLENTSMTLASSSTLTATTQAEVTLVGQNTISAGEKGTLTVTGDYKFQGNGSLDFVGQTVKLGNGTSSTFQASSSDKNNLKIGVSAKTIETNSLTLTDLTLQALGDEGSTITNTLMTLSDSIIEAIGTQNQLTDLTIKKGTNSAKIEVENGKSATFRGNTITIEDQTIELKDTTNTKTTLTLEALEGVTLSGGTNELKIEGKDTTTIGNNALNLYTPMLTVKGKVTLDKLTIKTNQDLQIVGTEIYDSTQSANNGNKGLFFTGDTTIDTSREINGGKQYHTLTFTSDFQNTTGATEDSQAYVSFGDNTKLEASDFIFQNQNIQLANGTNGVALNLYAYGTDIVSNGGSGSAGVFVMTNTTFKNGTGSKIAFYGGSEGVSLLPTKLTLNGVSIDSMLINGTSAKNSLDLSTHEGSITVLGSSTISATKFVYGDSSDQGIGVDLNVGWTTNDSSPKSTTGQLTLKSDTQAENFLVGGNITLDLRDTNASGNQAATSFDIELGSNKLSNNSLGLTFKGGGLTVIGDSKKTTYKFQAKTFTFEEIKEANGDVVKSPFVKVQNSDLELNGGNSMSELDLVGTAFLLGDNTNEAKLKVTKNGGSSAQDVLIKLHDIEAVGKASIQDNKLEFVDSNIKVSNSGNEKLLLKNMTNTPPDIIAGTINSITLDNGKLNIQNSSGDAKIKLKADSVITSSGNSELKIQTIKVGDDENGLYSLKITDGTFSLVEKTAGNQLGAITLGTEGSLAGGNFVYYSENGTPTPPNPTYNDLKLKGDITSYGNSSINANKYEIKANGDKNYTISSLGGELKLIAQDTSNALTATADISLNNGTLGYYTKDSTLSSLSLDSSSSVNSIGDSTLKAKDLKLNGASISASGGTLTLKGISTSTTAGNVVVGNAGVLTLQNSNTSLATLRIKEGSTLGLSADVAYVTPDSPLGGGKFGQVKVQSLLFESRSGSLINIALNTSSTSSYADSLFALREGAITLITTQDGIKKKESNASYTDITLEDITTDTSGLISITLTPYLQSGTDKSGNSIIKDLLLDLRVSQTNVAQLIESIKDPNAKESMSSIVNSGNNALILESIMQGNGNALKVGMAEYIAQGNVAVVGTALDYINGAIYSLEDSMLASNKIYELIAMLRTANVENRMVRGKNPFMAKTQLSHLIKAYSGVAYASSDDELLLEEEYTGPNYGEIWASFDGAMSFSQEESGNSSLYGFSAGYDTLLGEKKNYLLGFYASYGYGANSVNYARNNSHNFGLGFYTRMSFESSEVDLILSQNIGLNHTDVDLGASGSRVAQMLKQTLAYNFYTTDIEARYGYVFKVGSEESPYYFRPFGGINFALIVNSGARGDGEAELGIEAMNTYQLSVSVGVEMRKYFGEENYLYLLPILQKGLLNDGGGTKIGFYGTENIAFTPTYNVDTTMAVYLGGQGNIGENLAVNGGVGVKLGFEKKDLLTNWNVGLRYKF